MFDALRQRAAPSRAPVVDDVPSGLGIESYHLNGYVSGGAGERRTISGLKDLLEVL